MIFYTYIWLREDGTPYYVGKGSGNRAFRKGSPPADRILLQEYPDEATAFAAESFLIAIYGRKDLGTGCLRNLTDGGEGGSGHIQSESARLKIGIAQKNRVRAPRDEATKRKIGASNKGRMLSFRTRELMSNAKIGKKRPPFSLQHRLRIAESVRKARANENIQL